MRLLVVYRHYQRVPFHQEFVYRTQCSVGWHSWTLHYLVARNERAKLTHSLTLSNESYPDLPLAIIIRFLQKDRLVVGSCIILVRALLCDLMARDRSAVEPFCTGTTGGSLPAWNFGTPNSIPGAAIIR